jgi:hypothetical protein
VCALLSTWESRLIQNASEGLSPETWWSSKSAMSRHIEYFWWGWWLADAICNHSTSTFFGANITAQNYSMEQMCCRNYGEISMIMKVYEMLRDKLDQLNTDPFSKCCFAVLLVRLY